MASSRLTSGSLAKRAENNLRPLPGADLFMRSWQASNGMGSRRLISFTKQHAARRMLHVSASSTAKKEVTDLNTSENREVYGRNKGGSRIFKFYHAGGEEVIATVTKEGNNYKVNVVIRSKEDNLCMQWNIFRSRSSDRRGAVLKDLPAGTKRVGEGYQSVLQKMDSCVHSVQLELGSNYAPSFIDFIISPATKKGVPSREAPAESHFVFPVGCGRGHPDPLGSTIQSGDRASEINQ